MTPDEPQEHLQATYDNYRDAAAILRAVTENDLEAFVVIVHNCRPASVIHCLATMLMAGLWQLEGESLDRVFARIEQMQQQLQDGGQC